MKNLPEGMKKFCNWIFGKKENKPKNFEISLGERDEKGFCDTYLNGKKTGIRMLVFTPEQMDKFHKIEQKIHDDVNRRTN